ncbi:hypothetical protein [Vibrio coralliilyticus]|uniref:hypothetical protein n=1 Tax=Vibrio coralliilyticus TaxID=190893 RepID=UPI000306899F|nr:hypothetical protein [Vibrio coralliilyticus]
MRGGTNSIRVADALEVPHVVVFDLIRQDSMEGKLKRKLFKRRKASGGSEYYYIPMPTAIRLFQKSLEVVVSSELLFDFLEQVTDEECV